MCSHQVAAISPLSRCKLWPSLSAGTSSGVGFAIPIDVVKSSVEQVGVHCKLGALLMHCGVASGLGIVSSRGSGWVPAGS